MNLNFPLFLSLFEWEIVPEGSCTEGSVHSWQICDNNWLDPEDSVWSQDFYNGFIRRWGWLEEVDYWAMPDMALFFPSPLPWPLLCVNLCSLLPLMVVLASLWPRNNRADQTWGETCKTMDQESIFPSFELFLCLSWPIESLTFFP